MGYIITPINDIKEHTGDLLCECNPYIIWENGERIIVHNSFDGRESLEWTNEILKENNKNK